MPDLVALAQTTPDGRLLATNALWLSHLGQHDNARDALDLGAEWPTGNELVTLSAATRVGPRQVALQRHGDRVAIAARPLDALGAEDLALLVRRVAHDLDNLGHVVGNVALVLETPCEHDRGLLRELAQAGRRSTELADLLRAVGRGTGAVPVPVDLADVLDQTAFQLANRQPPVDSTVTLPPVSVQVFGDSSALVHALTALAADVAQDVSGPLPLEIEGRVTGPGVVTVVYTCPGGCASRVAEACAGPWRRAAAAPGGAGVTLLAARWVLARAGSLVRIAPGDESVRVEVALNLALPVMALPPAR